MQTTPTTPVTVTFHGGPYDGQSREMKRNPKVIGCVTDAHAAGMHGVYRTDRASWDDASAVQLTARWSDIPRKQ